MGLADSNSTEPGAELSIRPVFELLHKVVAGERLRKNSLKEKEKKREKHSEIIKNLKAFLSSLHTLTTPISTPFSCLNLSLHLFDEIQSDPTLLPPLPLLALLFFSIFHLTSDTALPVESKGSGE